MPSNLDLRLALPDTYQVVGDKPVKIKCREHADKHPSLHVYTDHLHCYGKCGLHLAGLDALKYLLKQEDVDVRCYTSESLYAYRERAGAEARRDPLPYAMAQAHHRLLWTVRSNRLEWLYARGLSDQALQTGMLGHDGFRFTIPVLSAEGHLLTIRYRRDDTYDTRSPKYCGLPGRNGLYLYPENLLAGNEYASLVVCEGELDCLRLWQEGIPAVTVTNGAGQVPKLPGLLPEGMRGHTKLLVATDMDEAGEEAARLTLEAAHALDFEARRVSWPESEGKDVSEWLAHHTWEEATSGAVDRSDAAGR